VGPNGVFVEGTPLLEGQHVFKANDSVIDILKAKAALVHVQAIEHSYPHCWRHKTPIIFRATPQWFISMDKKGLRQSALQAVADVDWVPGWGEARIKSMIEGRPDWCVSRQRTWGVPIALFIDKKTGALHPDSARLTEEIAQRVEQQGIDAWFELDPVELLGDVAEDYEKITDTLDVWFDSGVTHFSVLDQREDLSCPADLYLEGSDQHRGWFQSSLLSSIAMRNSPPYKQVLTHGFTVDANGQKMSKSKGNVVSPQKIFSSLGADILRLWVSATDYRGEMTVSDEILKRTADAYRRIRNTARYLLSNMSGFDPVQHSVKASDMLALDRWVVERAKQLQTEIEAAYASYEFHHIYQQIHHFCSIDLGSFYIDVIKDRQYTTQENSVARRSAQTALYYISEALVRWMAPILSFTAEEIWGNLPGDREESIFLSTWYDLSALKIQDEFGLPYWQSILGVRDVVSKELEKLRVAGDIGSSLGAEVDIYCGDALYDKLSRLDDELRFVLITSYAQVLPLSDVPDQAVMGDVGDEKLGVVCRASGHAKCARCWHHREDVGQHTAHPELCGRCVDNVSGSGEQRYYA
ncbi:MAG: class I tRNA ligase family protein, partial [Gammaproteobacteria bacterium]